jgi:hypothetical protein
VSGARRRPAPLERRHLRRIWTRMAGIYGNRWTGQFGHPPAPGRAEHPAVAVWARGLAGHSPRELAAGLDRLERAGAAWPPALPEFRDQCRSRPADFGLPEPDAALEEAARRRGRPWSHPAVRLAAEAAFTRPWGSLTERDAAFLRAYRHLTRAVMAGAPLAPPPPEALGPPPEPPAHPDEARRHLAALRAAVGLAPRPAGPCS